MAYADGLPITYGPFRGGGAVTVELGVGIVACTHGAGVDSEGLCVNCRQPTDQPFNPPKGKPPDAGNHPPNGSADVPA